MGSLMPGWEQSDSPKAQGEVHRFVQSFCSTLGAPEHAFRRGDRAVAWSIAVVFRASKVLLAQAVRAVLVCGK